MNNGYCGDTDEENPWYVDITCERQTPALETQLGFAAPRSPRYSASGNAEWYLNMTVKGELKKSEVTEAVVQAYSNCPVMGLFRAGMIQREEDTDTEESEIYVIQLAYDKSIYEGYPPGAKEPDIKIKPYGLVAVKPEPPGDVCSVPYDFPNVNYAPYIQWIQIPGVIIPVPIPVPTYDRRVPCKAHDYCWDLVRFTVAPGLSEDDCDRMFLYLMYSDCADREDMNDCRWFAELWEGSVSLADNVNIVSNLETQIAPGVVVIQNVETDMCVDVEDSSEEDSAPLIYEDLTPLIQSPCTDDDGQIPPRRQFRFHRMKLDKAWYFGISPAHRPNNCVSITTDNDIKLRKPPSPTRRRPIPAPVCGISENLFVLENAVNSKDQYTIQSSSYSPDGCLAPETSDEGSGLINEQCQEPTSRRHLWEIREVGCWIPETSGKEAHLIKGTLCPREQ